MNASGHILVALFKKGFNELNVFVKMVFIETDLALDKLDLMSNWIRRCATFSYHKNTPYLWLKMKCLTLAEERPLFVTFQFYMQNVFILKTSSQQQYCERNSKNIV